MSEILTVTEAAGELGVSRQRILQWIDEGRIEPVEVWLPGVKLRFQWGIPVSECVRPPDMRRKEWR